MADPVSKPYTESHANRHIEWIFEKIFRRLTLNCEEIWVSPWNSIVAKTFDNPIVHQLMSDLTTNTPEMIQSYLSDPKFRRGFVYRCLNHKVRTAILFGDRTDVQNLCTEGYSICDICLKLMVVNNRLDMWRNLASFKFTTRPSKELLAIAAEFSLTEFYFYLRQTYDLIPNVSVYNKAVLGQSLEIVQDINKEIGLSQKILTAVTQTNDTPITKFVIEQALEQNLKPSPNLVTYPILNENYELLEWMETKLAFEWHAELYYSAILSGSLSMMHHVENKLATHQINIHQNWILDTSRSKKKGRSTVLLEDIIYQKGTSNYFSHTMNYAIQSGSVEIVKYIWSLGYGITPSNFVTAVQQATVSVLEALIQMYSKPLPSYLIYYFGLSTNIEQKFQKLDLLIQSDLLDLDQTSLTVLDYKKESVHLELITDKVQIKETGSTDLDYLMNYPMFFSHVKGFKPNHKLIVKTRYYLQTNNSDKLSQTYGELFDKANLQDRQILTDLLFLFGTPLQMQAHSKDVAPSLPIVTELICYAEVLKLCFILHRQLLPTDRLHHVLPLVSLLDNSKLNLIFAKWNHNLSLRMLLSNLDPNQIRRWIQTNPDPLTNYIDIKNVLRTDQRIIIELFDLKIGESDMSELIDWSVSNEYMESAQVLKNRSKN